MGKLVTLDRESANHICDIMWILVQLNIIGIKNPNVTLQTFKHSMRSYITFPRDEYSTEFSWYLKFSTNNI